MLEFRDINDEPEFFTWNNPKEMVIYVVYDHPLDIPEGYVLRRQIITPNGQIDRPRGAIISDALAPLQQMLHSHGLTCLGRQPADDPVIVESWM